MVTKYHFSKRLWKIYVTNDGDTVEWKKTRTRTTFGNSNTRSFISRAAALGCARSISADDDLESMFHYFAPCGWWSQRSALAKSF